jgi:hypothetical protein
MGEKQGHPFRGNQFVTGSGSAGRYDTYDDAARNARDVATRHNMDVAIRRTKEYGKTGFNVSYAAKQDSDYARAEIIKPGEPQSTPRPQTYSARIEGRTGPVRVTVPDNLTPQEERDAAREADREDRRSAREDQLRERERAHSEALRIAEVAPNFAHLARENRVPADPRALALDRMHESARLANAYRVEGAAVGKNSTREEVKADALKTLAAGRGVVAEAARRRLRPSREGSRKVSRKDAEDFIYRRRG